MLRSIVGSRVAVELVRSCDECWLDADVSQFETAIVNMAVNARDAMEGEGAIGVTLEPVDALPALRGHAARPGAFVAVSLSDNGVGIPEETLDRIFEPFFTTKGVGKGTGLGLSQVYGFAKQTGGDVSVSSPPGRGATFTLFLPRGKRPDVPAPAAAVGPGPGAAATDGGSRRILVVEDNVDVGRFSTQLLEDLGYLTTWTHDAREALDAIDRGDPFDVVFSDVVMPGMNGVNLAHAVRERRPGMPVILTSGYSDVLADEGRHGFPLLKKPYAAEELSRLLRRTIDAGSR